MREVVIVSGTRTPIGAFGGTLASTPVVELGSVVLKETLQRAGLRPQVSEQDRQWMPDRLKENPVTELERGFYEYADNLQPVEVDQVIMGNVLAAGQGQNVARQAMIRAGIPKETAATTINKLCASGMEAVALAAQAIRAGDAEVILAGGMENMSLVPYALPAARWGQRMNDGKMTDLMVHDGLFEIFYGYHMGMTAENIAGQVRGEPGGTGRDRGAEPPAGPGGDRAGPVRRGNRAGQGAQGKRGCAVCDR